MDFLNLNLYSLLKFISTISKSKLDVNFLYFCSKLLTFWKECWLHCRIKILNQCPLDLQCNAQPTELLRLTIVLLMFFHHRPKISIATTILLVVTMIINLWNDDERNCFEYCKRRNFNHELIWLNLLMKWKRKIKLLVKIHFKSISNAILKHWFYN